MIDDEVDVAAAAVVVVVDDDDDDDDDRFVGQRLAPGHARSPFVVD